MDSANGGPGRVATNGYVSICPSLHYRDAPGASSGDAAKASREAGGVPDSRCIGDVAGAAATLRSLPYHNGRVGVIGYCSGGRQAWSRVTYLWMPRSIATVGASWRRLKS